MLRGGRPKDLELEDDPRIKLYQLFALNNIAVTQRQRIFINNMTNFVLISEILELIEKK